MSSVLKPRDRLWIYYLQGRVSRDAFADDPGFVGNWEEEGHAFLFFSRESLSRVEQLAQGNPELLIKDHFRSSYEEWLGTPVHGFRVGPLQIHPVWETNFDQGDDACLLRVDPGVVFGAGNHQTTSDCLRALVALFEQAGPEAGHSIRALDMGCGSGLLSLAAAGLGCERVLALDLNPLAVRTCRNNSLLNNLEARILSIQGRAEEWIDCPADLLLANIHYDVLKGLVQAPGFDGKRWFILSGLLRSQAREILAVLRHKGAELIKIWDEDGAWFTILGRN